MSQSTPHPGDEDPQTLPAVGEAGGAGAVSEADAAQSQTDPAAPTAAPRRRAPLDRDRVLLEEAFARQSGPIDFRALFGRGGPVELEIGSGRGTFLVARAAARPDVNLLGLEWARPYCHAAAERLARHGLANVRMLRADAVELLKRRIAPASLQRVHVYFPDPWPKTRQRKRRSIRTDVVDLIYERLVVGGQLAVVTDHRDYARQMAWVLTARPGFAVTDFPRTGSAAAAGEIVGTNFERKYIAQGRQFFAMAVMKLRP